MRRLILPALFFVLSPLVPGCGESSPTGPSSPAGVAGSHNPGRDCMSCHGRGEAPAWTVAGTVYHDDGATPYVGATVRLTTAPAGAGSVLLELMSDGSGNFYTNRAVALGGGVFASVAGSGESRSMQDALASGACNACHDASNRLRAP